MRKKNIKGILSLLQGFLNSTDNYIQQRWVYFKHSFYYISSTTKSWQDSRNDCLQRGADLVIINSKEEQVQFKQRTWIGLTDRETEGTWRWLAAKTIYTNVQICNFGEAGRHISPLLVETKGFTANNVLLPNTAYKS
uniref:C-type lectin domain-containing protein n=1 Tax=Lates calcarifer TaxID=8187 RepID=A0A4W6EF80_LATCA